MVEAVASDEGEIPLEVAYRVMRTETVPAAGESFDAKAETRFLAAASMIPVDGSLAEFVLGDESRPAKTDVMTVTRRLYDGVNRRMRYDKPTGKAWGRGDAAWACANGFGNCTDFHSIFIGACRDLGIPARFEMGFLIPTGSEQGEVGGYHCWAKFAVGGRWIGVDISEADKNPRMTDYYFGHLSPNRVTFITGRDLKLSPSPASKQVNFLIYPYVEVAGQPHETFTKQFRYEDIIP